MRGVGTLIRAMRGIAGPSVKITVCLVPFAELQRMFFIVSVFRQAATENLEFPIISVSA
jgi:hypothetical protein